MYSTEGIPALRATIEHPKHSRDESVTYVEEGSYSDLSARRWSSGKFTASSETVFDRVGDVGRGETPPRKDQR